MSEENKKEPTGLSDIELQASEKGWVPEKEWDGDPEEWRPAKEFLDRGELMDRISNQTKQINQYDSKIQALEANLKQLAEHNKKVAKLEYDKAMEELKKQKASALDLGDHTAVVEIDDKMSDLKETKKETETLETQEPVQATGPHPEVTAWMADNTWYNTDVALQGAADAIARQYLATNPAAEGTPAVVLNHVKEQIVKEFPDKFGTRTRPSGTVETQSTGRTKTRGKQRWTKADLNDMQKAVMKEICSEDGLKESDYIQQLGELGELG